MSLVEILVTIFVLAIGLLAVVRVLIPGLAALPRAEDRSKGSVLAQDIARTVESRPEYRADSIEHAVRVDANAPNSGWVLHQDISMGSVDQISPTLTLAADGQLSPLYPSLVIGERFDTPLSGQVYLVNGGPYVTGSLRVYYPEPLRQVEPGFENQPGTFSVSDSIITVGPGTGGGAGFMASFSALDASGVVNVVGRCSRAVDMVLSAMPILYSVTLYVLAHGMSDMPCRGDPPAAALRQRYAILACAYGCSPTSARGSMRRC